ncbi:MAG TPA: hypothetical protein VIL66_01985 [Bacillota bacterium]
MFPIVQITVEEENDGGRVRKSPETADDQGYLISLNSTKFLAELLRSPQEKDNLGADFDFIKSRYLRPWQIFCLILIIVAVLVVGVTVFTVRFS